MFGRFTIVFSLVLFASSHAISATPQMPNWLTFEGKEYPIDNDPTWEYFEKHPTRKPRPESPQSALWRGYLAFFEFRKKNLFLKDLKIYGGVEERDGSTYLLWKSVLKETIGDEDGLRIDWFSGLLVSRYGENNYLDAYDITEYRKHYTNYAIFEIDSGVLTSHRFYDNKSFHRFIGQQLKAFKKTREFRDLIRQVSKNGRKLEDSEAIIKESLLSYTKRILVK